MLFFNDFWKHFCKPLFSSIFEGFKYYFGGDLGRILHQIAVFSHLKNDSDFGTHFRAPRGAPRDAQEPDKACEKVGKIPAGP